MCSTVRRRERRRVNQKEGKFVAKCNIGCETPWDLNIDEEALTLLISFEPNHAVSAPYGGGITLTPPAMEGGRSP